MWRETNLLGIYLPPLVIYAVVALLLWMPLRFVLVRMPVERWLDNPAILHLALYMLLLATLVTWL